MQYNSTILANGLVVLANECFWLLMVMLAAIPLFISFVLTCLRFVSGRRRQMRTLYLSAASILLSIISLLPLYNILVGYPSSLWYGCVVISLSILAVSLAILVMALVPSQASRGTPHRELDEQPCEPPAPSNPEPADSP